MENFLNFINNPLSLVYTLILFTSLTIIYFILDRKVINKKYYSAFKKSFDYVTLTLKVEEKEKVLKNLKDFQKKIYENAQFIHIESQKDVIADLEKKRIDLVETSSKLALERKNLISQIEKAHSELSNEDIDNTYDTVYSELTSEIASINIKIKELENAIIEKKKEYEERNLTLKKDDLTTKTFNEYTNLIIDKLDSLTNLIPFYVLIAIEYVISMDFFSQLYESNISFLGYEIPFGIFIPFIVTTLLLITVDLCVKFAKEKQELNMIITGLFSLILFFIIAYSRIYPQINVSFELLIIEILKLLIFIGVIVVNYYLMEKYKVKSEDVIFLPIQTISILFEMIINTILKISATGNKIVTKKINTEKLSHEGEIKKMEREIKKLNKILNQKIIKRSDLNSKKDTEISVRKEKVSKDLSKRFRDVTTKILNIDNSISKIDRKLVKALTFGEQTKNGSFDGTSLAVKKFYRKIH